MKKSAMLAGVGMLALAALAGNAQAGDIGWLYNGWTQWHPHRGPVTLAVAGTQYYFSTPAGVMDSDGDGVTDDKDQCPGTPQGVKVDSVGCPLDSDGDGVPDYLDKCPGTPMGVKVDSTGCPIDSDGDGVYDNDDKCPGTPQGATVNQVGCWVVENLLFDYDKSTIKSESIPGLEKVVKVLRNNPGLKIEVAGHTDNKGSAKYNKKLSERRAAAVAKYLTDNGIDGNLISSAGYGFDNPVANNDTPEGRALNRRVELTPRN